MLRLGPILRFVDDTSATVWMETAEPGTVEILGSVAQTFTIEGHHYALVMIDGLAPGSTTEYQVDVDGRCVWPEPTSTLPPSLIRTTSRGQATSILVGSCRAAAPHEPPFTRELTADHEARGVDTLWAHAVRIAATDAADWPDLLLFLGDQIYADDSSPSARERIEQRRDDAASLPPEIVADYEEYCWLYQEAWSGLMERWLLSTVPSAMIFDDHDMVDDWNISADWVHDIRRTDWWRAHAVEGLMSYWVHQHLGNLSPAEIRTQGLLDQLVADGDGSARLRAWAERSEESTPVPGGYRFSHARRVGDVCVIVIDCRNARVLDRGRRMMVGPEEWEWVCEQLAAAERHVLLATSVPVFIADGLHDLQAWNERLCDGQWGRVVARCSEWLRRALDLEDWSAFLDSFRQFRELIDRARDRDQPLDSIIVVSGDIHFSYAARVPFRSVPGAPEVWQVVSSPIRNALIPPERSVMRATLTRTGARAGALLRRSARLPETRPSIEVEAGPFFANNMCRLDHHADGDVHLVIEQAVIDDHDVPQLNVVAALELVASGDRTVGSEGRARWESDDSV